MKFLICFLEESMQDDSGMPKDRFSAERTEGESSSLRIHPSELDDSGVYFCASSWSTVLQRLSLLCKTAPSPLLSTHGSPEQTCPVPPPPRTNGEEEPELTLEIQEYFKKIWVGISVIWGISGAPYTELNLYKSIFLNLFYSSIVDLQCCVNFYCTAKWFSYIYTHLLHILFHYGLSQDIEYSSLCCIVGPCCLSILYIIVCIC